MKQLNIPFKLGMQYENWEFDLELKKERILGCDSYIYIGKKFNKFLNYNKFKTELVFNLDILEAIIINFKKQNICFTELPAYINLKLNCFSKVEENKETKICKFVTKFNEVYVIQHNLKLFVLITNPIYAKDIINSLL